MDENYQSMINKIASIYPTVRDRLDDRELLFLALRQFSSRVWSEEDVKTLRDVWEKVPEAHGVELSPQNCLFTALQHQEV